MKIVWKFFLLISKSLQKSGDVKLQIFKNNFHFLPARKKIHITEFQSGTTGFLSSSRLSHPLTPFHWHWIYPTAVSSLRFLLLREKLAKMCKLGCSFALVDDVFGLAAVGGGAARGRGCGAYFSALLRFCSPDNSCRSRCTFLCNCSFSENSQAWRYSSGFATQHCILHRQK